MALFSFTNRFKHKSFDYKPRFYDQEQEERDAKFGPYRNLDKNDPELIKQRIKGGFSKPITQTYQSDSYRKAVRKSNKFVFYIAMVLLAAITYFILEYFPKIVESFQ